MRIWISSCLFLLCVASLLPVSAGVKRALLVGVTGYDRVKTDGFCELSTGHDTEVLRQVLVSSKYGFDPANVHLLTTPEETTHAAIVKAFRTYLVDAAKQGDILYFHFSGHGSQTVDRDGTKLNGLDDTMVPSDYRSKLDAGNDIVDNELHRLVVEACRKKPENFTLSFDCCHSGNLERGRYPIRGTGKGIGTRGAQLGGSMIDNDTAEKLGVVCLFACEDDQTAKEYTDLKMGVFTYALAQAMNAATPKTTYDDLIANARQTIYHLSIDQNPLVKGKKKQLLFQGAALPSPKTIPVVLRDGDPYLDAGEIQGITKGSRYTLYRKGTTVLATATPLAEAAITRQELTQSKLRLTDASTGKVSTTDLDGALAVEVEHAYGDNRLKVLVTDLAGLPQGQQIIEAIRALPLAVADIAENDDWDVRARIAGAKDQDAPAGSVLFIRKDGTVTAQLAPGLNLPLLVKVALERESRVKFMKALVNHPAAESPLRVEMRLVPVRVRANAEGIVEQPADILGNLPERPTVGGQMMLNVGDYVMIELRNTSAVKDGPYITILDIDGQGKIGPLWPHPAVPGVDNRILNDGAWHRLPHPFVYHMETPGQECFRAIVTENKADFSTVLDAETLKRGDPYIPKSPLEEILHATAMGVQTRGAISPGGWMTTEVLFKVVAKP